MLLVVLVANFVLFNKISTLISQLLPQHNRQSQEDEGFSPEQADKLLEKGQFNELTHYCEAFYKEYPNSTQVNWYYALSYYNLGQYDLAKSYFSRVVKINPLWQDGANAYLHQIDKTLHSDDCLNDTVH